MLPKKKVLIIGAGAAGQMASIAALLNNNEVILAEKNNILGKKLRITGKGRCNMTNACSIDEFLRNVCTNSKFLYSAVSRFSPADTIDFFVANGLSLKVERGNRVFPTSDKAEDVANVLIKILKKNNCKILHKRIKALLVKDSVCLGAMCQSGEKIYADAVILATGGISYPSTGSTGDGFKFARRCGHTINELKPSLVPLICKQPFCKDLQGLSLKNVAVSIRENPSGKKIYEDFGEMLFTHFGVSGPIILSASCHLKDLSPCKYSIHIDLKPALDAAQLDKRILRDFGKYINKNFSNALLDLLPSKMIPIVVELSNIDPDLKCHQITKEMRARLVYILKDLTLDILDFRPIEEAIVTSGGISTDEINPKTMESKLIERLFFAGEIIDVDAYTGGFNLQIAFSTGFLAGQSV
ncbi:MAG: NAD(P)/FAD-dependent oxidoreductase [Clostridia bacterium]|nr:NAD(P)/FAD-dependent oxidoreductase [Clostridia bacterium]